MDVGTLHQIGINTRKNIFEGKNIRVDEDGFENFEDYFTETDTDESDIEIEDKSSNIQLIAVKHPAEDGSKMAPLSLSNFPSRKRLSFPVESMSDSCSIISEGISYVKSVISKRGMKSSGDTFDSEDSDHEGGILSKIHGVSSAGSSSESNNKMRRLNRRGMKSFPEDEESFTKKPASLERPMLVPAEKSFPQNVCELPEIEPENMVNNRVSGLKECQEKENNLENVNENKDVLLKHMSPMKKKQISKSVPSKKNTKLPQKVISAFGVHKQIIEMHYFDVLESNLCLIDDEEKPVKKSEGASKLAEKYKVNLKCGSDTAINMKRALDSEDKSVSSDGPQNKSSPLQHKKPQISKCAFKIGPSDDSQEKSSRLPHKKSQQSPTAKCTLKNKNEPAHIPQNKSSPLPPKNSQSSLNKKQGTLKRKNEPAHIPQNKSSPLPPKNSQSSLNKKQGTLKRKSEPVDVLQDKSSPLQHKTPQPSPSKKHALENETSNVSQGDLPLIEMSPPLQHKKKHALRSSSEKHTVKNVFAPKQTYKYISNKALEPSKALDIIYCCCLNSENGFMGLICLKKGAYKPLKRTHNEEMFLVQYGEVKVRIGCKTMVLSSGDSFMIPANEIYSLRNKSNIQSCGLIVIIVK